MERILDTPTPGDALLGTRGGISAAFAGALPARSAGAPLELWPSTASFESAGLQIGTLKHATLLSCSSPRRVDGSAATWATSTLPFSCLTSRWSAARRFGVTVLVLLSALRAEDGRRGRCRSRIGCSGPDKAGASTTRTTSASKLSSWAWIQASDKGSLLHACSCIFASARGSPQRESGSPLVEDTAAAAAAADPCPSLVALNAGGADVGLGMRCEPFLSTQRCGLGGRGACEAI
jgi:hypothetical protein